MNVATHRSPLHLRQESSHAGSLISAVLLALVLSIGPVVLGGARTWILLPIYGCVSLLLAYQALRLWMAHPPEGKRFGDSIDALVLLFVAYAFFLFWTVPVGFASRVEMFNLVAYAGVFFLCRYGLQRTWHMQVILAIVMLVASGITVYAFFLWKNPDWLVYGEDLHLHYFPRLCGTYGCPNHFGYLAVVGAAIALSFVFFSKLGWVWRIICIYLALMMIAGVFLSLSRGSWLAMAAAGMALTLLAVRSGKVKWYWPVIGFIVLAVVGVAAISTNKSMWQRVEMTIRYFDGIEGDEAKRDITSYVRYELARDSFQIYNDYPVWGTGPASFENFHQRYQQADYKTKAIYTHNDYLNALTDYGTVGALLILGFMFLVSWRLLAITPSMCEPGDFVVLGASWAAWAAIVLHSVVDFNMHIPGNALVVFALAGMGLNVAKQTQKRSYWLPSRRLLKPLAAATLLVALGLGIAAAWTAHSYYPYLHVKENKEDMTYPESTAMLKAAAENDPYNEQIFALLGDIYRVQAAQRRVARDLQGQIQLAMEASQYYRQASALSPINDDYMLLRAQVHDMMRRHDEAFLMYRQAIDQRPYNGYYYFLLGRHFLQRGMVDEARATFKIGANSPHGRDYSRSMLTAMDRVAKQQAKAEAQAKKRAEKARQQGKEAPEQERIYDPVTTP